MAELHHELASRVAAWRAGGHPHDAAPYAGLDGRAHDYTPDFVVHATGDRWLLVEVKMTARRADPVEGASGVKAKALRDLEQRNPGRIFYRMVFADKVVGQEDVEAVKDFLRP